MSDLRFSIIIPVYNVEKYLRECVDSVLAQTFERYEVILVDDGSPDSCPAICDEYASKDARIKVIHKPNGGLSDARNAGLDIARGEYILFLDSDDWWDKFDFLHKLDKTIEDGGADIVIFGMKKFYSADNRIGEIKVPQKYKGTSETLSCADLMQEYMGKNIFVASACDKAISRAVLESPAQRFVKGQLSEDVEWCCKLLMKELTVEVLEEAVYVYRQQVSTSISANVGVRNIQCILDVIRRYATTDSTIALRNFLANQYVLLITNFMRLPKIERKQMVRDIRSYWWLLDYNWYPYVKKVSIVKPFGFNITKELLRLYYRMHR